MYTPPDDTTPPHSDTVTPPNGGKTTTHRADSSLLTSETSGRRAAELVQRFEERIVTKTGGSPRVKEQEHTAEELPEAMEKRVISDDSAEKNESDAADEVIEIDGTSYYGVLSIPLIGVELPVSYDYSPEQMGVSLCRYEGTLNKRDLIICGHNYSSFLHQLGNVSEGTKVYFTDALGKASEFRVSGIVVIGGYDKPDL